MTDSTGTIQRASYGESSEHWCVSHVNTTKLLYTWQIQNYSFVKEKLNSSVFSPNGNDKIKWRLEVDNKYLDRDYVIACHLILVSGKVRAKYDLYIPNTKNEKVYRYQKNDCLDFSEGAASGCARFATRNDLLNKAHELLPKDTLTIRCEIVMVTSERVNVCREYAISQLMDHDCCLSNDFCIMLNSQEFSDVTLRVSGLDIRAHKNVLAARSPVFAAMFRHQMQEHTNNFVDITDTTYEALYEMLSFMYTGKTPNMKEMARELLVLGDMYALDELKTKCEDQLSRNLTANVAAELLILADLHSAALLKYKTKHFIVENANEVMETSGFKTLFEKPELALEVCRALYSKNLQAEMPK